MKQILLAGILFVGILPVSAQDAVTEILHQIALNNKELRANQRLMDSRKAASEMEMNLPDPTISYTHQYGNRAGLGIQGELVASQAFDFPLVYREKHRLVKAEKATYDQQEAEVRQALLLQAKEICLDLILLNKQQKQLDTRLQQAELLEKLYVRRLESGDANRLEINKINLELLNVRNECRMNETARKEKLEELAVLNGGTPLMLEDTVFAAVEELPVFEDLKRDALAADARIRSLQSGRTAALRRIDVSKRKNLPGFELGYRLNTAAGGERFNGFLVGVSLPLFANRHAVRRAKAESLSAELLLDNGLISMESELLQLYHRAVSLRKSIQEYQTTLQHANNLELLNKAILSGQISMFEYIADATIYYQSMQNFMQLQHAYQTVLARLYRYRL